MSGVPAPDAQIDPGWFLLLFGALALATVVAAVVHGARRRDVAPVAVCLGALVCALNEPIYDELGMIVYAGDAARAYTAWDRDIPLFLVVGYVPWVAGLSYVVAELLRRGGRRSRLHAIALGSFASVVAIETAGTSVEAWTYYGEAPLKYLGVAPQMAPVPIVCGVLIHLLDSMLTGPRRLLIALAPIFALPAVYAAAGMPIYLSLHSDPPKAVQVLAGAATLALCTAITVAATGVGARWRSSVEAVV